jgi:hypothetical protein
MTYTRSGDLQSYTTDVRPTPDSYGWFYDEVGNRTAEQYSKDPKGQPRTYYYKSGLTNQLASASGVNVLDSPAGSPGYVGGFMDLGYDQNGNVSSDIVSWDIRRLRGFEYLFQYNSRHRLSEIDGRTIPGNIKPWPYQENVYDGLDRVAEVFCPNLGVSGAFGFCQNIQTAQPGTSSSTTWPNQTPCPPATDGSATPTWEYFYYGPNGQLLEEQQNNNIGAYGNPAYDVIDHVYLGQTEIAQVILQNQNKARRNGSPTSCVVNSQDVPFGYYVLVQNDVLYLHHDNRNALIAVESQNHTKGALGKLVWEAEVSPFGQAITVGVRGPSDKIGAPDTQPDDIVSAGVGGALPDGRLGGFLIVPGEADPSAGRSISPSGAVWSMSGRTSYDGTAGAQGPGGIGSGDRGFGGYQSISAPIVRAFDDVFELHGDPQAEYWLGSEYSLAVYRLLDLEAKMKLESIGSASAKAIARTLEEMSPFAKFTGTLAERLSVVGLIHSVLVSNTAGEFEPGECISSPCTAAWLSNTGIYAVGGAAASSTTPEVTGRDVYNQYYAQSVRGYGGSGYIYSSDLPLPLCQTSYCSGNPASENQPGQVTYIMETTVTIGGVTQQLPTVSGSVDVDPNSSSGQ